MKTFFLKKPREYEVGIKSKTIIKDVGKISLDSDEQITFVDSSDNEYDLAKKNWGYYATPSINKRLKKFNYKTALVKNNETGLFYVMIVYDNKINEFNKYISADSMEIVCWLDESKSLSKITNLFK